MTKNFALIGAAGFVAPRHMKAIAETGNTLVAALDPSDSVGIIDSHFPSADFFTEFERFDRHVEKLKRQGEAEKVHFVSITSPNYLHDSHIRFALRVGANAISEKPLVLNPWNIDALMQFEQETGQKTYNILQLRVHPSIIELKKKIEGGPKDKKHEIDLTYITSRGHWYMSSWKSDIIKSGGIASNIGVHFYDMLTWIFGDVQQNIVHVSEPQKSGGYLELENARVRWFLSIDYNDVPEDIKQKDQRTYRSITVDGDEIEFSGGFFDLHTISYQNILDGNGFGLEEARSSIETVHNIRNAVPLGLTGEYHPFLKGQQ
jgi:UDP-N-acetyl-2-amino-2-deoxyglucuronate dehydrogenase